MLSGFGWVRKCMWVELNQTKNGVSAECWRLMKSIAASANSSSTVSMRLRVSGPVSSIFCLLPFRAQECSTPRGPKFLRKSGNSSAGG